MPLRCYPAPVQSDRDPYVAAPQTPCPGARRRPDAARVAAVFFAAGTLLAVAGTVAIWRSSALRAAAVPGAATAASASPRWLCLALFDPSHLNFATMEVQADGKTLFSSPLSAEILDSPWPSTNAGPFDFRLQLPRTPAMDVRILLRNPKGDMLMEYAVHVDGDRAEDMGALQGQGFAKDTVYGLKALVVDGRGKPLRQSR